MRALCLALIVIGLLVAVSYAQQVYPGWPAVLLERLP